MKPGKKAKKTASATRAAKRAANPKPAAAPKPASHSEGKWAQWFVRSPGERRYWLVKSEPETFSFDDLLRAPNRTTFWDGVRNFAARNFLRDGMKLGDRVFFYHSSTNPQAIVGICEVVCEGYPDPTALDRRHPHYDPASDPAAPQWFVVDLRAVAQFTRPVTLAEVKARKELSEMALVRIGRLSVTPVSAEEWDTICKMAS
ncbi:MAG: EVE domain-containing protein [Gemmatimonadales bacterium]